MDWSSLEPWMLQSLNASNLAQLANWTETELYQYAELALHAIGRKFLLIVQYDDSTALVANQAIYPVPANHIVTIFAAADGNTLTPSEVEEMEALDDDWEEAASVSEPTNWVGNALGVQTIRVYPPKNAGGTLQLIFQLEPPNMPVLKPLEIKMPAPVGDYLVLEALEAARRRQGDGQMLDAAQAFNSLGTLYEQVFASYWGSGE